MGGMECRPTNQLAAVPGEGACCLYREAKIRRALLSAGVEF
jgi:hypothetical protein